MTLLDIAKSKRVINSNFNSIDTSKIRVSNSDKLSNLYSEFDYTDWKYKRESVGDLKNFKKLQWMKTEFVTEIEGVKSYESIGCINRNDCNFLGFDEYLDKNKKFHFFIGEVCFFPSVTLHMYLKNRNSRSKVNWFINKDGFREFFINEFTKSLNTYSEAQIGNKSELLNEELDLCNKDYISKKVEFDAWCYGDGKVCNTLSDRLE